MISRTLFSFYRMLVILLSISPGARSQEVTEIVCRESFDNNPAYEANLKLLFSTLSNVSRTNNFYNFAAALNTSNATYGQFMCRGDVAGDTCQRCVAKAARQLQQACPNHLGAAILNQFCSIRYSERDFFDELDRNYAFEVISQYNLTDWDRFNRVLGNMLDQIATQAANDRSGKKFAVQERNFSSFQKLYALAQCTPDISKDDCDACLHDSISRIPACCDRKQAARIYFLCCEIRNDTTKFCYVDATPAPIAAAPTSCKGKCIPVVAIVAPIVVSVVLFVLGFLFRKRKSKKRCDVLADATDGNDILTAESLQYSLSQVQEATNNFSFDNKIGEGGFGDVYKGKLPNGQEIAVKRLSRTSVQGVVEFKNEILLLAELQHRNLVRLLGFSFKGEEKILIYEFVPNKSLDYFLFDLEKQRMLDWPTRHKILLGIARGLRYLHEDSQFRIIHRDLKASNVLLDENMNPKIADFGMARIFRVDQSVAETSRIAGTYGYMAPEYIMHGQISVKSDAYSFGVLALEIISGRKNSSFFHPDRTECLPSYAWKNWRDGTPLALLDPAIGDSYARNEVIRCIQVGLLCVQEDVEQRPNMATAVRMLNSYSVTLPAPQRPAFFVCTEAESLIMEQESDKSTLKSMAVSENDTSITEPYPRWRIFY